MMTDPVCGMKVDPKTAPAESTYEQQKYYFCGQQCKEEFDKDPERYAEAGAGTRETVGTSSRGKRS